MKGQERFRTALGLGAPDMVPVFLRDLTLGLDEAGYTTPEVCAPPYDAEKSARAVLSLQRRLDQDAVVGCIHYVGFDAQALGGAVMFPEKGIPAVTLHPLEGNDWMDKVEPRSMREEPYSNVLRSYELVSKGIGEGAEVVCNVEGPMTKAALLRGIEQFAIDLQMDEPMAREVTELSIEISLAFMEEAAAAGAGTVFLASATDNPALFGPEAFREHSLPGVKRLRKKASDLGLPTIFHPHGVFHREDDRSLIEDCIDTGVQGIQFAEENDLAGLKGVCRGRVCTLGGLDVISALLLGSEEKVERETRMCLDACAPGGGFILMCSCSIHRGTPLSNVDAMVRACRRYR